MAIRSYIFIYRFENVKSLSNLQSVQGICFMLPLIYDNDKVFDLFYTTKCKLQSTDDIAVSYCEWIWQECIMQPSLQCIRFAFINYTFHCSVSFGLHSFYVKATKCKRDRKRLGRLSKKREKGRRSKRNVKLI